MLTEHLPRHHVSSLATSETAVGKSLDDQAFRPGEIRPAGEFANFLTHGFGFLLSLPGAAWMVWLSLSHPDAALSVACVVYSLTLVGLYAASTLSHAFYDCRRRRFYRTLDQACIFLLISGSFTPFAAAFLRDGLWPVLFFLMWACALTGAFLVFRWGFLSAAAQKLYVAMGWLPAIGLPVIIASADVGTVVWVVAGGLLYTAGTFFLWYDHLMRYFHATWHLFVIGGSFAQYMAILSLLALN
ncbi:MAG TPA: hemolysin III family protein [Planctomicrobium sp.]|nr:hemolysin III family protein [Planctomicrobium sp.]